MNEKIAGELMDEVKYILDGIKRNHISKSEVGRAATIGALTTALAGAGWGALTGKKGKKDKKALKLGIIGALAGGVAGPAYAQLRKYLDGIPFDNSWFDKTPHKKGDKVYLGVAGSANGEGDSWFASEMRRKFGGNVVMLRHVDDIAKKYNELKDKGLDVTVVGHSSGGASAARFLRANPDAKGYLIDPVSWLGRGVPKNAVVFTSDESTRHGGPFENTIADVGGRWNHKGDNSVVFKGSHSNRMRDIIKDYVATGVTSRAQSHYVPKYVTQEFGKDTASEKQGAATEWSKFAAEDDMAKLFPKITPQEAQRYSDALRRSKDPGWRGFLPSVPQAEAAVKMLGNAPRAMSDAVQGVGEAAKDIGDEIEYQLKPITLDDEAARYDDNNDPYYHNILVGGANAGGKGFFGISALPFGVLAKGKNRQLFRNGQIDKIRKAIEDAKASGKNPRVVGHSWGGADVAGLAEDYPTVPFIALDPTSWGGRLDKTPKNLTIFRPKEPKSWSKNTTTGYLAQVLGGEWPKIDKGEGKTIEYDGGHVSGIGAALNDYVKKIWNDRIRRQMSAKQEEAMREMVRYAASGGHDYSKYMSNARN